MATQPGSEAPCFPACVQARLTTLLTTPTTVHTLMSSITHTLGTARQARATATASRAPMAPATGWWHAGRSQPLHCAQPKASAGQAARAGRARLPLRPRNGAARPQRSASLPELPMLLPLLPAGETCQQQHASSSAGYQQLLPHNRAAARGQLHTRSPHCGMPGRAQAAAHQQARSIWSHPGVQPQILTAAVHSQHPDGTAHTLMAIFWASSAAPEPMAWLAKLTCTCTLVSCCWSCASTIISAAPNLQQQQRSSSMSSRGICEHGNTHLRAHVRCWKTSVHVGEMYGSGIRPPLQLCTCHAQHGSNTMPCALLHAVVCDTAVQPRPPT